ncbi:MAG: hypothetical protein ACW99Q_19895 [Candidatus Kariarchaeaceae archaeon]|jgi:hypothetical protein
MSIQQFYNAAKANEFARDFQFRIRVLGPFTEDDLVYMTTSTLPGRSISNQPVPFMGLQFNVPGSVSYDGSDSWTVNFRCDEGINIRNKLENWQKEIFDDETSTGKYGVPAEEATLDLLGKDLEPLRRYNLIGIYPVSIGPLNYDITGTGTPVNFDATFAYQYWRLVG